MVSGNVYFTRLLHVSYKNQIQLRSFHPLAMQPLGKKTQNHPNGNKEHKIVQIWNRNSIFFGKDMQLQLSHQVASLLIRLCISFNLVDAPAAFSQVTSSERNGKWWKSIQNLQNSKAAVHPWRKHHKKNTSRTKEFAMESPRQDSLQATKTRAKEQQQQPTKQHLRKSNWLQSILRRPHRRLTTCPLLMFSNTKRATLRLPTPKSKKLMTGVAPILEILVNKKRAADFSRFETIFFPFLGFFRFDLVFFPFPVFFSLSGYFFPLPQGFFSLRQKVFFSHRNGFYPLRKGIFPTPKGIFHVSGIFPASKRNLSAAKRYFFRFGAECEKAARKDRTQESTEARQKTRKQTVTQSRHPKQQIQTKTRKQMSEQPRKKQQGTNQSTQATKQTKQPMY